MHTKRFITFMVLLLVSGAIGLYAVSGTYRFAGNIYVPGTATIATLAVTSFTQTNIDAGASGSAGTIDVYPGTASRGKIAISAANNAANHTIGITNASHGQATVYTIQDCGQAAANFIMSQGAQTIAGIKTLTSLLNADGGIAVDTSNFTVSGTTGAVATASDLAVGGNTTFTGTVTGSNNLTVSRTLGALPAATTGYVIGVPRVKVVALGTGSNGAAAGKTLRTMMDDTPAGEWTAIDADVVRTEDASYAREGTKSLKLAIADTADDTDGVTNTLGGGDQDWSADESFGFWAYSTKALDAGDLKIGITDSVAGESLVSVPAIPLNTWTWVEVDISAVVDASKDVITDLSVELSAAGAAKAAAGAFDVYIDSMTKWDSTEEDALTISGTTGILNDGCLSVFTIAGVGLVEYTDYIVHYQSGAADAIVYMTDQSAATSFAYVAY